MNEVILHHYPQSPVSEKVRVGLGIKGLAWRSVEIPRLPPKPDLMPLTGGYRRTPVMQVGADVYCDSQCILRELERRFPEPTFTPGGSAGMVWGLSRWTDGIAVRPRRQADPRRRAGPAAGGVRPGPGPALSRPRTGTSTRSTPTCRMSSPSSVASSAGSISGWRPAGRSSSATSPGLPDVLAYYLVWFVRGRWSGGPRLLSEFPSLEAWERRVEAIGHGRPEEMTSGEALDIAAAAEPATPETADPNDPQGLAPGMTVAVVPEGDGGDPPVAGTVRLVDRETIAILREDPRVGTVCVHFPRIGYRVTVEGDRDR